MTTTNAAHGINAAIALLNAIGGQLRKGRPTDGKKRVIDGITEAQHGLIEAQNRMEYLQRENDRMALLLMALDEQDAPVTFATGDMVRAIEAEAREEK